MALFNNRGAISRALKVTTRAITKAGGGNAKNKD